ncbi:unnamed protein product [Protopolystoma xenopodis]|uniref:Uncharacterized protein n=1 Tax=Protopolystoma xenopodis TaxID=117903 RepID=A0A3S5BCZ6_9PLAT|nr:unnamed protein product [Protopolystoma xenopodis]
MSARDDGLSASSVSSVSGGGGGTGVVSGQGCISVEEKAAAYELLGASLFDRHSLVQDALRAWLQAMEIRKRAFGYTKRLPHHHYPACCLEAANLLTSPDENNLADKDDEMRHGPDCQESRNPRYYVIALLFIFLLLRLLPFRVKVLSEEIIRSVPPEDDGGFLDQLLIGFTGRFMLTLFPSQSSSIPMKRC